MYCPRVFNIQLPARLCAFISFVSRPAAVLLIMTNKRMKYFKMKNFLA